MITASGKGKPVFNLHLWHVDGADRGIALSITEHRGMKDHSVVLQE